ncbi:hypothetical protein TBK1r_50660 [Stieleria magnilauensis]|uniref:Uncharacterized protein n=2 Tax=Stieleria magnilauensis TaxID=2527963 RepID=A0ABX5Y1V6_9BACT|nr:hypothetical protein TBK1r_50660 [Planctomycetes bacterium TBK1r]
MFAVFAAILRGIGVSWLDIGVAGVLVLVLTQCSIAIQSWVERRTGRQTKPNSEAFDALYFLIAAGIGLPPIFLFPNLHPFAYIAIVLIGAAIANALAIAFFGEHVRGVETRNEPPSNVE